MSWCRDPSYLQKLAAEIKPDGGAEVTVKSMDNKKPALDVVRFKPLSETGCSCRCC
jgi:hypothetical protein